MNAPSLITWNSQLVEIAQAIGEAAVVQLCQAFGGTRVYIPRLIEGAHPIAQVISAEASRKLSEYFHGTHIDFPKAYSRRARAVELATTTAMTQKQAARAADYSERHLRRLLTGGDDKDQFKLF